MPALLPSWLRRLPKRRLGYIKDPSDPRDLRYSATLTRPALPPPESVDLRSSVSAILDQGSTSSCVAHAYAYAIDIVETLKGLDYNPVSRLYLYYAARAQHGGVKQDSGTYLRSAARALQLVGAPAEKHWPFTTKAINKQPRPEAYMEAHPRRDGSYERIDGLGDLRLQNIKRALAAGHPVVFGTLIAESFLDNQGPARIQRPKQGETIAGGHAMCCVGYDRDGFIIVNSWGRGWREDGFARMTHDYMAWAGSSDFWMIRNWHAVKDVMRLPVPGVS